MNRHDRPSLASLASSIEGVVPLVVVDGGARGGPAELSSLSNVSSVYAFEPSPSEFERLGGFGDLPVKPQSGTVVAIPTALSGTAGSARLHISLRPGATSTIEPNRKLLDLFAADNWSEMKEIVNSIDVPTTTIDDFARTAGIDAIDFLKLDTQGNELDILKGATSLLDSIGVIKVEVEFIELYKGQPLFHDVAAYLHAKGFELVDFEISPSCRRFHELSHCDPRSYRLVWADMIMVRRPHDSGDPRSIAKAFVLAALGYIDLAVSVLRRATKADDAFVAEFVSLATRLAEQRGRFGRLRRLTERRLGILLSRYDWRSGHQVPSKKQHRLR